MSDLDESEAPVKPTPLALGWPATFVGPVISGLGAAGIPLSITQDSGLAHWMWWITDPLWFVVGLLAFLLGIVWTAAGASSRKSEVSQLRKRLAAADGREVSAGLAASDRTTKHLLSQMSPVIHDLGNLLDSKHTGLAKTLIDRCLEVVIKSVQVEGARACLYYADQVELEGAGELEQMNSLVLRKPHLGRHDKPRKEFIRAGDEHAEDVFAVLDSGESRLIPDVDDCKFVLDCEGKAYKTFMNVAVGIDDDKMGILSLDAPIAGSLTETHREVVEMVADILAIGVRREKKKSLNNNPSQDADVQIVPQHPVSEEGL